ncbi:MAG: GFA family protein [Undibacterium sp.]
MQAYQGKCHCGAVTFLVQSDLASVIECNCSHCAIKSLLLTFVPASQFQLRSGEADLSEYRFNKHVIAHLFCRHCGVEAFGKGNDETGVEIIAINIRTLEGIDLTSVPRTPFDGKKL